MRALDQRLVRRTRSVRPLLAADTALGLLTVALIIVQATLLAYVVARAFDGASLSALWLELAVLACAFAARGALAWAMEVAGRRAATDVLSELRLDLDPSVEAPSALAPLIDPNLHSCGSVPPHGEAELRQGQVVFLLERRGQHRNAEKDR